MRDYGTAQWDGGDAACDHANGRNGATRRDVSPERLAERAAMFGTGTGAGSDVPPQQFRDVCGKCGATRIDKQFGLEPTIAEYVANMVDVFRLVREVLADDGTLWLNLGDSYTSGGRKERDPGQSKIHPAYAGDAFVDGLRPDTPDGLKPKDLCGIPWRVAFALQADGWYLRSDIIWSKPNPMPESVTDRPTKAHEYLFLLAKSERYFYDASAIAEPVSPGNEGSTNGFYGNRAGAMGRAASGNEALPIAEQPIRAAIRNKRTVWTIATSPYADAHFAVFPRALVEPCILAGTSERGHCRQCGKGWARVTETDRTFESGSGRSGNPIYGKNSGHQFDEAIHDIRKGPTIATRTTGWEPTCDCNAGDPVPGVVLDPFMGSGTVGQVAQDLGRRWIGCELNPAYVAMQERRTAQSALVLAAAD